MDEMGLLTWYIVQLVLWAGPLGIATFLAVLATGSFAAGYFFDLVALRIDRRKPKEIAMSHQKPIHGKTDILPDGTNTPVDIFN
jgi:hypothetical protein